MAELVPVTDKNIFVNNMYVCACVSMCISKLYIPMQKHLVEVKTHLASQVDGHTHTCPHSRIHALGVATAGEDGQALVALGAASQETLISITIHFLAKHFFRFKSYSNSS